jgi:hypothetical protein
MADSKPSTIIGFTSSRVKNAAGIISCDHVLEGGRGHGEAVYIILIPVTRRAARLPYVFNAAKALLWCLSTLPTSHYSP